MVLLISLVINIIFADAHFQFAQRSHKQPGSWRLAAPGAEGEEVPLDGEAAEQNRFKERQRQHRENETLQKVILRILFQFLLNSFKRRRRFLSDFFNTMLDIQVGDFYPDRPKISARFLSYAKLLFLCHIVCGGLSTLVCFFVQWRYVFSSPVALCPPSLLRCLPRILVPLCSPLVGGWLTDKYWNPLNIIF